MTKHRVPLVNVVTIDCNNIDDLLDLNIENNRKITPSNQDRIREDMVRGTFFPVNSIVKIAFEDAGPGDMDEIIIDGQTRLTAIKQIIETINPKFQISLPMTTLVSKDRSETDAVFSRLDCGKKRSIREYLIHAGKGNSYRKQDIATIAAACRYLCRTPEFTKYNEPTAGEQFQTIDKMMTDMHGPFTRYIETVEDTVKALDLSVLDRDEAKEVKEKLRRTMLRTASLMAVLVVAMENNPEHTTEFIKDVITRKGKVARNAREWFDKEMMNSTKGLAHRTGIAVAKYLLQHRTNPTMQKSRVFHDADLRYPGVSLVLKEL